MKLLKFDSYLVVRLEKDEDIITALTQAIRSAQMKGGFFYGLGVGKALELGYFDAHKQAYIKKNSRMSMNSLVSLATSQGWVTK